MSITTGLSLCAIAGVVSSRPGYQVVRCGLERPWQLSEAVNAVDRLKAV